MTHIKRLLCVLIVTSTGGHAEQAPLVLEAKIALGEVSGRIDHLAFDARRERLYVAELGNNSVGVVDLKARRVLRTASGFDEPQGVGYEPISDTVYVANGGDGSVRLFSGEDFAALGTIPLGTDADNVRIDSGAHRVYVGYGNGALAVIDSVSRKRVADIPLPGHPESFQLDPAGPNVFVNIPDAKQIVVISRDTGRAVASWPTGRLRSNYPLALDGAKNRVLSVFREPAHLQAYDARSGEAQAGFDVCEDSDDVFVDAKRRRVYVICGDGYIDVLDAAGNTFAALKRVTTLAGSRTGLFLPDSDRLLVAVRAAHGQPAAVWICRVSGPFRTK